MYNDEELQYISLMQGVVTRLATTSFTIKQWTISIVTALIAVNFTVSKLNQVLVIAIIPILAFWYLDSYYLGLERAIRNRLNRYVNLKTGKETIENLSSELQRSLFDFTPLIMDSDNVELGYRKTTCLIFSFSVFCFYIAHIFVIFVVLFICNYFEIIVWYGKKCFCFI